MTNELVTQEQARALDLANPQDVASLFVSSGYWQDMKQGRQALVKIIAGRELGIGAFASQQGFDIIKGKLRMNSNLLASLVQASGRFRYRVRSLTIEECVIEFFERENGGEWEPIGTSSFTMEDAKRARLTGKDNWQMYPQDMLKARAMSRGVSTFCPVVTKGIRVYTEGDDFGPMRVAPEPSRMDALNARLGLEPEEDAEEPAQGEAAEGEADDASPSMEDWLDDAGEVGDD